MFFKKVKLLLSKKSRKEKLSLKENYSENKKKLSNSKNQKLNFKKMTYKEFEDLFIKGKYQNKKREKFKKPMSFVLKKKNYFESPKRNLITKDFKKLRDFQRGKRSYIINKKISSSICKENFAYTTNRYFFEEKKRNTKSVYKLMKFFSKKKKLNGIEEKINSLIKISKCS